VEGNAVIQRLNDAFDNNWNFTVVEHHVLSTGEVLVLGRIGAFGVVKEAFGKSSPAVSRETGEVLSEADAYKSAATDSLKKCATMLGVALYLYSDDIPDQADDKPTRIKPTEPDRKEPPAPANRASSKQVSAIWSIGRKLGLNANEIRQRCLADYGSFPENLDRAVASRFIGELADEADRQKGAA
jgi:hypothetical protein